jgi:beta-phosphoglucomutase
MDITSCIFDLDGVIVDTAKYHYLAWRRLARELGFDFSPEQNERLKGVSRMRSLEILLEIGGMKLSEKEMEEAARRKNAWYVDFITTMNPDEIFPGVIDFIKDLDKYNIKKAIGSASKNAGVILNRLQIENLFDALIDGTKVTKAKPDPEIFLLAANALKSNPDECLVFEDAQAGVEAAKNGGMVCIGIGDPETLNQADWVIRTFENLEWQTVLSKLSH